MTSTQDTRAFEVVMASAGTGKTFALTNRLAGLLARGVPPERILAATFTRQAAGEIRERLLTRIANAAADDAAAAELSVHAGVALDASGWLEVLKRLCRSIHRVRMGTLDSTAQGLARSLAPQLGLVSPWRQAFDHVEAQLRAEVVERLLLGLGSQEERASIRTLTGREGSTRGDETLAELLADSGAEIRRAQPDAWACLAQDATKGPSLDEVRAAGKRIGELPIPENKNGTPNKNWAKAQAAVVSAVERGDFGAAISTKLVAGCEDYAPVFSRVVVPGEWIPELRTVLRGVIRLEVEALHQRNLVAGALLSRAVEIEDDVRREHRAYSLGDLWRALAESDLETQQVAYQMDAQFDHVLLDEFQDTSIDQWRVLEPLIDEAVAGGDRDRSVFVVGDVKQSLYGWRNAQAGLLPYVSQHWQQMHTSELVDTYRCRGTIVHAVNQVFGHLRENPSMQPHGGAAARFADQFETHKSAVNGEGFVRVVDLASALDEPDDEDEMIRLVADAVARTHNACAQAEIAVLVRRRRVIGKLVIALAERGVPAVSNTSASPCDHPVVEAVLSALYLAAHPGDGPSRFAVATSPLGRGIGLIDWSDVGRSRQLSRELAMRVFEQGLARTVEWLASHAGEAANDRGRKRLADLVHLAEDYEAEAAEGGGIDDFIASVRASRVQPRGGGLVRVLTLHAAKGLQFDAVFLMDVDGSLASRPPRFLSDAGDESDDPTAVPTRMSLPGTKDVRGHCSTLAGMYGRWRERAVYDELCLLYVGMTRAKAHLEIFVRSDARGLGSVVWAGLGDTGGEWRYGSEGWMREVASGTGEAMPVPPTWARPSTVPENWCGPEQPWRIATVRPSELGDSPEVALLLSTDASAAELGSEVHRLLEAVEWLEDAPADPEAWAEQRSQFTTSAAARVRAALDRGELQRCLARASFADRWDGVTELSAERERPISVVVEVKGRSTLVRGRIDRLVLGWREGRVVRCAVFDFKTGDLGDRGPGQLDLYRRAIASTHGLSLSAVEGALVPIS